MSEEEEDEDVARSCCSVCGRHRVRETERPEASVRAYRDASQQCKAGTRDELVVGMKR